MNESALKETLNYISEIGYITADTRNRIDAFVHKNEPFDAAFDDESKKELSGFYDIMSRYYMEHTGQFLPNIFYVEEK